ncbi:hypothetical protein CDL15_Pgr017548 [Punica granatum]|uniref:Uncharacterized protein n=1 Tax=Punica granatum TaxID=22663 RepID=A0A218W6Q5_PUNGR|nr:hypothetical protein CDL15_Pgr017548 [Punica granatum]
MNDARIEVISREATGSGNLACCPFPPVEKLGSSWDRLRKLLSSSASFEPATMRSGVASEMRGKNGMKNGDAELRARNMEKRT